MKFFEKKIIHGCEARGDAQKPYLMRFTIIETSKFAIYFHKFLRSDADDLHDHPWNYRSFVLWPGYNEVTFSDRDRLFRKTTFIKPFSFIKREAKHAHRVELIDKRPAYSIIFRGGYVRTWGFYVGRFAQWLDWNTYFKEKGC